MAARVTPSKGGKPDKLFRDAIMVEVKRLVATSDGKRISNINMIAAKVVERANAGDLMAAQMVRDSIDGKPAQSLAIGQDPGLEPLQTIVRPALDREAWLKLHGGR